MSKIKSKKYSGVYYTELKNKDKSFFITYKDYSGKKNLAKDRLIFRRYS